VIAKGMTWQKDFEVKIFRVRPVVEPHSFQYLRHFFSVSCDLLKGDSRQQLQSGTPVNRLASGAFYTVKPYHGADAKLQANSPCLCRS